ncbi:hypothetical protein [Streptomyces sp. NPDC093094]|uniref:hypothetical protein n=1 Tax=Streptomyces sp. NPDC093094 TaxID=3366026 RepID=UPI00382A0367
MRGPTADAATRTARIEAGDRGEGLSGARTHERLAGLESRYDPASLFGGRPGVSA